MNENPLRLDGAMVLARLKTQHRIPVKPQPAICRPSGSTVPEFVWCPIRRWHLASKVGGF